MNYLAHLLLSCEDEELLIGNFIGDYVSNKEVKNLSLGLQKGIQLHRLIDSYTDSHPVVKKGIRRMQAQHAKYAGVVIDVLYDYILANNWSLYGPETLQVFADKSYAVLLKHIDLMPVRLHTRVKRMVAANWLIQYSSLEGIAYVFERISERASKPQYFQGAVQTLQKDEALLTEEFAAFFPDIVAEVGGFCAC